MSKVELVNHFPMVPADASITDISAGRVFEEESFLGLLADKLGLTHRVGSSYHWSSSIESKPSWAIVDDSTKILHIRAHDCPFPATPLHPTCRDCIRKGLADEVEFVFHWKTVAAERLTPLEDASSLPDSPPSAIDRVVRPAGTPINEIFDTPWTDVRGTARFTLGQSLLLLQHCGACPNPMDARLSACSSCVQSRAPPDFPGDVDYIMFVKMIRPDDGMEWRSGFPGLRDAMQGEGAPPRWGEPPEPTEATNEPDDTGSTKVRSRWA